MKAYRTIETLPIFNYARVQDSLDFRYLLILDTYEELPDLKNSEYQELALIWEDLQYKMIDVLGISESFKEVLQLEKTIALLKCKMIESEDKSIETIIAIKERELADITPTEAPDIEMTIVQIEARMNIQIDILKTTVRKYLYYLKYLNNAKN